MPSPTHRGAGLGLPADGPGSVARLGLRAQAFVLDCLLAGLLAFVFTFPEPPGNWSLLAFAVMYVAMTTIAGRTPGMEITGLRLAQAERAGGPGRVGVLRAVLRTALVMLVVPALFTDRDGRGLHDRLTGTAVILAAPGDGRWRRRPR